jgi:hypothetical protein
MQFKGVKNRLTPFNGYFFSKLFDPLFPHLTLILGKTFV